jgi:hypothetical protein
MDNGILYKIIFFMWVVEALPHFVLSQHIYIIIYIYIYIYRERERERERELASAWSVYSDHASMYLIFMIFFS